MAKWNDKKLERKYNKIKEYSKLRHWKFKENELKLYYLEKLLSQCRSNRILRMVHLAFILGELYAIRLIDTDKPPTPLKENNKVKEKK